MGKFFAGDLGLHLLYAGAGAAVPFEIAANSWESGTCCSYLPDVGEADFDRFYCCGTKHAERQKALVLSRHPRGLGQRLHRTEWACHGAGFATPVGISDLFASST